MKIKKKNIFKKISLKQEINKNADPNKNILMALRNSAIFNCVQT